MERHDRRRNDSSVRLGRYLYKILNTLREFIATCDEHVSAEKEVTHVRRRYHVEDYIAERNIRGDAYGRILHFILMPIFSVHLPYFFCEISRFSGMIVLYYRLAEKASSALVKIPRDGSWHFSFERSWDV